MNYYKFNPEMMGKRYVVKLQPRRARRVYDFTPADMYPRIFSKYVIKRVSGTWYLNDIPMPDLQHALSRIWKINNVPVKLRCEISINRVERDLIISALAVYLNSPAAVLGTHYPYYTPSSFFPEHTFKTVIHIHQHLLRQNISHVEKSVSFTLFQRDTIVKALDFYTGTCKPFITGVDSVSTLRAKLTDGATYKVDIKGDSNNE